MIMPQALRGSRARALHRFDELPILLYERQTAEPFEQGRPKKINTIQPDAGQL